MSAITQFLNQIHNSVYGRDMRSAIYYGIAEAFGQNGTYTDQFICTVCTGVTLVGNKTRLMFFIPLHNATKRDVTIVPQNIVIRGDGWYETNPSVTYTYAYQMNGIIVTATINQVLEASFNSNVSVEFSYDITLG